MKNYLINQIIKPVPCALLLGLVGWLPAWAGTVFWNGPATTNAANNWSVNGNWSLNPPATSDDVKFVFNGAIPGISNINNTVDASTTIGSLQYGATNIFHTTLVANGVTLLITNTGGLLVVSPGDPNQGVPAASVKALTNWTTITGAGGTLAISNSAANLVVNQGSISNVAVRGVLDLSGLGTFTANVSRVGLGTTLLPNPGSSNQREHGILYLAKTNFITMNYSDTLANYQTSGKTNAIEMSRNAGNNPGTVSYLYLGQTNVINVDSLAVGMDKSGNNSTAASGSILFNPALAGSSPVAVFRGISGGASRVTWWSIGDGNASSSSSNGGRGTNDFSLGIIDAMINVLSLGRECDAANTGWAGPHSGVLSFNAGTVDANTVYLGNEAFNRPTSMPGCVGILNIGGPNAVLKVNTSLVLGQTTVTYIAGTQGTNALRTSGVLNVTNGASVWANTISVGAASATNLITLSSATLIVSNTLATNASGLFALNVTNSLIGLTVPADGSLRGLVQALNTAGATNLIQLDAKPVFMASYPKQFPLIKYTTWNGSNNFGLTNLPAWAAGATLVSNGPNKSLDLSLPADPRPIFSSQPSPYSGSPGDSVTTNFAVTIAAGSVTPLGYQWYYSITGVSTNPLSDGSGPSGSSTLSGSTAASLLITNAQPGDSGNYFVVVTNAYGTNTSSQVLLTISGSAIAPTVNGPANVNATNGITTTIPNTISGSPVPGLYWQYNGAPLADGVGPSGGSTISGSSSATLTISNPQYPGDQGTYSLIASNSAGLATNNTVLTVLVPPAITNQPVSLGVTNSQAASFTVVAGGVPAPQYQWSKNGTPVSSAVNSTATNATFSIASASPVDIGNYSCTITNLAGTTNTVTVMLTVNSLMTVTAMSPGNGQTGVCYDTPLYATFSTTPTLRAAGKIRIYNATNSTTPVDTVDLSQCVTANATYAANIQPYNIGGDTFTNFPVIITGTTAAIYPHHGLLTSNQTYYVTLDNGTFTDSTGAYFVGITSTNAWHFTTKVAGPANSTNLVVVADGSGDFLTVQGAVDSVPANNTTPTVINIRNGTYTEAVDVKAKHNLDFRGQSRSGTVIGYPNNNWVNGNGAPWRAMFIVNGNDCSFENLTITNTTPSGGSQAEAIDIEGTRDVFCNMELDSFQDTFLVHSAGKLVYFQDSLIQGQTDFNWGYGTVYYTNCELRCLLSGGHVTQPRSPSGQNGFGFINCRITQGYAGSATFDLGRTINTPTSPSEALFYNCLMADVVPGYSSDAGTNMADYNCSNLTATAYKTLANSTHSPSNDPFVIAIQSAATWLYGWNPALSPNITGQPVNQSVSHGQPASFTVSATGIPVPTFQWLMNGSPIAGATNATYAIAGTVRTNGGNYSVVVNNGSGSVTSSVAVLTYLNTAPVAANTSYIRFSGVSLHMAIIDLLTNVTDVDGDLIALVGVGTSTNGVVLVNNSTNLFYQNPNNVNDQFAYTVTDGFGGTNSGLVSIVISTNSLFGQTSPVISTTNGVPVLEFAGIPGYSYSVTRTTNVTDAASWAVIWTTNAPPTGAFQFIDPSAPQPTAFYRLQYNP